MASLGASSAFASEIFGNRLSLCSSQSVPSSSTPAAFKPVALFSKKKAKPVAVTPASEELAKWYGPDRRIFLPNGLLDKEDIPEYLDGEVPGNYGYNPLGLEKKPEDLAKHRGADFTIHKAFNKFGANSGPEVVWSEIWILDSGASYHMCPHKKWFDTFEETDDDSVLMGDETVCRVAGVGTVKVKMFDGIVRTLGDVRYIPALKKNVISLGRLDSLGYGFEGSREELKVAKGSMVYMKGDKMSKNLYRLQGVTMVGGAAVSTLKDSKDTTHTTRIKGFSSSWVDRKSTGFLKKRSKNCFLGPDRRIFLPNGLLDKEDILEYLEGEVPGNYGYDPLGLEKKPEDLAKHRGADFIIHKAFNKFGANSGPEVVWSEIWILDSGASFHVCPHKKWFDTFEETDDEGALMGDETVCRVAGVGTVKVKMFDGIVRTLRDVRYIPALKKNVISLGRLDSLGYGFEGSRGELKVTKGSMVYMKGDKMSKNLYRLQGVTMVGGAAVSTLKDSKDNTHTTRIKGFSSGWVDRKSTGFLKKRSKNVRHRF